MVQLSAAAAAPTLPPVEIGARRRELAHSRPCWMQSNSAQPLRAARASRRSLKNALEQLTRRHATRRSPLHEAYKHLFSRLSARSCEKDMTS